MREQRIDVNGMFLEKKKDKQVFFSKNYKPKIKSIIKFDKEEAYKKYGKLGKKGVLQINIE